ncbi:MAG: ADP-ribose pyrophosphatase [Gracilibacter sp. BRH_c7a]|nr:MAG: ADP-ribose pyrophosphatase [Gracilibacter sp. BRH_c7a]
MKNKNFTEVCLTQEVVFEGKVIRVQKDTVLLPNGQESTREVVHHPGAVAVAALKDDELIMVRQYRYALGKETLEIPAGKIDPGEEPQACAIRELREETGYQGELKFLGRFNTSPGFADEVIHIYLATNLVWAPLKPDEDEFIGIKAIPLDKAVEMVYKGEFQDAKTALGILLADRNKKSN